MAPGCFRACIFLTTSILLLSGCKIPDARDDPADDVDESLIPERKLDKEIIRTEGIMRSLRSEPIFGQGILRKLKRSFHHDLGERLVPFKRELRGKLTVGAWNL